jgi:hypothetical protein
MSANTYRLTSRERAVQQMKRSKPANVRRNPVVQERLHVKKIKGWLAAVLLLPLGLITAFTLGELLFRAMTRMDFWRSEQFIFFTLGGIAWGATYWAGWRPVRMYVLGHELSHYVVARAFGGKIIGWDFSAEGGYVETNKTNTWITLAPYLLPFYSLLVMLLFGIVGMFWGLQDMCSVSVGSVVVHFRPVWLFYSMLGLTWWFHISYTLKTMIIHQSDLETNGEFFSVALIFLFNVALIILLFLAASPAPGLGFLEVGRCWVGMAGSIWDFFFGRF